MALSKRKKKIFEDFFDLTDRYEAAFERTDRKNALKLGKEIVVYIEKFQKVLGISDEYLNGMKNSLENLEKNTKISEIAEAEAKEASRAARKSEQKYYKLLLEQTPKGKERTKH
jgi:hypothetical protein